MNQSCIPVDAVVRIRQMNGIIFYLWLALGGAVGTISRYGVDALCKQYLNAFLPWGTLSVNLAGSFVIGILFSWLTAQDTPMQEQSAYPLLFVGFCGAFTTFSSFSLQLFQLVQAGQLLRAFGYALFSVIVCLALVAAGYAAGLKCAGASSA